MKRNDLEFYDRTAAEWWDQDAKIYALHHLNLPRFSYFDRHVPYWQGVVVLDVGCGGGFSCEFMAQRGAIVHGIDQSPNCIAIAQDHAIKQNLAIDYQQGFAEALPYAAHTFDAVVCVDVLEHVADLRQTVAEVHRVLKPGGLFLFDTINRTYRSRLVMIWLLENLLQEIPRGIHDWHKFINPAELISLMQEGFTAIEIKGFNILGETWLQNIQAYRHYKQTGGFQVSISDNLSVSYIGKAVKI
jgi:2-polyprenyl-6-hydroxyphenyl methylase / 3-demethylubiquinone-9 3-methyltransferase